MLKSSWSVLVTYFSFAALKCETLLAPSENKSTAIGKYPATGMSPSIEQFRLRWQEEGEALDHMETGWKRVQQIEDTGHSPDTKVDMRAQFEQFLVDTKVSKSVEISTFLTVNANQIPWQATDLQLQPGTMVSAFAVGRVWRSRMMGLYQNPQRALNYKIGVHGNFFNSTRDTITFEVAEAGELFVASQFPGQFQEPCGRVLGHLDIYEKKGDGKFEVLFIVWKTGTDVEGLLREYCNSAKDENTLIHTELARPSEEKAAVVPPDWYYFWYIGRSTIYRSLTLPDDTRPCIHCRPYANVGILQKDIAPTIPFGAGCTLTWDWKIDSLPSRLREDTTFTHDYLSVAVEFENGRDITYTWSYELPPEYGYWCPLPSWTDREYHVVIRSGEKGLGEWLSEKRDLFRDYEFYIKGRVPKRIVRVWLIAGNGSQRIEGEMTVRGICVRSGQDMVQVL